MKNKKIIYKSYQITISFLITTLLLTSSASIAVSSQLKQVDGVNSPEAIVKNPDTDALQLSVVEPLEHDVVEQKSMRPCSSAIEKYSYGETHLESEYTKNEPEFVPGCILVKFKSSVGSVNTPVKANEVVQQIISEKPSFNSVISAKPLFPNVKSQSEQQIGLDRWVKIQVGEDANILEELEKYNKDSLVEVAQPDYLMELYLEPNDPYYHSNGSWGQDYMDLYGMHIINAAGAWDVSTGSDDVVVAVVDTGVDYNHPDIAANMWINEDDPPGDVDGDGNPDDDDDGFIDNMYGADFANNDSDPLDGHGHGTHCAGTIAAVGNNGIGVVGVNWHTRIMAVKGLSDGGSGSTETLANAIKWAADNGAQVISNSWGCPGGCPIDPVSEEAVQYAYEKGCVIVFAAGNDNLDVQYYSPQNMEETIAVAATDHLDQKASFSNWGELIDVSAPGVDILSTFPGNDYAVYSGTSMACPHVAGLAALILSHAPFLSNEEVAERIISTADNIDTLNPGYEGLLGSGRINASKALHFYLDEHGVGLISLDVQPRHMKDPEIITINATVLNNGRNNETDILIRLIIDDSEIDSMVIPLLESFDQEQISFSWMPPGIGFYEICVNISIPSVSEEDYSDNELSDTAIIGVLNTDINKCFETIQQALDDVDTIDNHHIIIPDGIYAENVLILKNISIGSFGKDLVVIDAQGDIGFSVINTTQVNISEIMITNGSCGLSLEHASNTKICNTIINGNSDFGIVMNSSQASLFSDNEIWENFIGIYVINGSENNSFIDNEIVENDCGISIDFESNNNVIYHNNFNNSIINAFNDGCFTLWDGGYFDDEGLRVIGGNWWADYDGPDLFKGPDQDEEGSDHIIDEPYIVPGCGDNGGNSIDRYPLKEPWSGGFLSITIYVDDDAPPDWYDEAHKQTIQEALECADDGDNIFVYNGLYEEAFTIDKSIEIIGENRTSTIISALEGDWTVIRVATNEVSISGFHLTKYPSSIIDMGIYLEPSVSDVSIKNMVIDLDSEASGVGTCGIFGDPNVNNITISECIIAGHYYWGIGFTDYSTNILIANNTIVDNYFWGIAIYKTFDNVVISNNYFSNNGLDGSIKSILSENTVISNNTFSNNLEGIYMTDSKKHIVTNNNLISDGIVLMGSDIDHWNTHTIENNIANGKPIRYYKNTSDVIIPEFTSEVVLANCMNCTISNMIFSNVCDGILIGSCSQMSIINNSFLNNSHSGIIISADSSNITVQGNTFINSTRGLFIGYSNTILVKDNNFENSSTFAFMYGRSFDVCIQNNYLHDSLLGIHLSNAINITVKDNIIDSNMYGVIITSRTDMCHIFHNDFLNNEQQALDESQGGNQWDNGYPDGGNFWSDYEGIDNFSGPDQDIPGSDGIVDFPYNIPGTTPNSQDHYPLMYQDVLIVEAGGPYMNPIGEDIFFNGLASGLFPPFSYHWDFGDGENSTEQNTIHNYSLSGIYIVTLSVTDNESNVRIDTATANITEPEPLIVDAGGPYQQTAYYPIQFIGTTTGGVLPYTYLWDFGDGNISTLSNPVYTYTETGEYIITLTVTDHIGVEATDTTTANITDPEPLVADAGGPYAGFIGEQINFEGSASGGVPPYVWEWDFGDNHSSNDQNPMHSYTNPGEYIVILTVIDFVGTTQMDTTNVTITEPEPLIVDAGGPYQQTAYYPIQFIGTTTGGVPPYTYLWDFGSNGNISTLSNPVYTYTETGEYIITLTVTDHIGVEATDTTTANITEPEPLVADAGGPYAGIIDESVQFIGNISGGVPPFGYHWDFGDGTTSQSQNPTHGYDDGGQYAVSFTVTDYVNNIATDNTLVTIYSGNPASVYVDDDYNESTPGFGYEYFNNIQDAINQVDLFGTVTVYIGTYYETINIYKPLTLIGENKNSTIIDGMQFDNVIEVTTNGVTITGFTIQNSNQDSWTDSGINIHSDDNVISNNILVDNINGAFLNGASHNEIFGNTIVNNTENGIKVLYDSDFNEISNNIINNNSENGIYITYSSSNKILGNSITNNNRYGIRLNGHSSNPSMNNNISGNYLSNNEGDGLYIRRGKDNTFCNNIIVHNDYGIYIRDSQDNTFTDNIIANNNRYGMDFGDSDNNNTLYHNTFIENTYGNVYDFGDNNWDDNVSEGNYWDDFQDNEGYPDEYIIPYGSNIDHYPLSNPYDISVINMDTFRTYSRIQDAIDDIDTEDGQTLHVYPGVYQENIVIDKPLNLVGMDTHNTIIDGNNNGNALTIGYTKNVTITGFTIMNGNSSGISIIMTLESNITISDNYIINNVKGIDLFGTTDVKIYHNNFMNNDVHVSGTLLDYSIWDDSYPSGGNYWDGYESNDDYRGPNQNLNGSDGIYDEPFEIEENSQDMYPLVDPWNGTSPVPKPDIVYVDDDYDDTPDGWGYTHFDNIQDGIDAIAEHGTVYVSNGFYHEHVVIDKTVNLVGADKDTTIIDGDECEYVVLISADRVNLSGFTIQKNDSSWIGILVASDYNIISCNTVIHDYMGILLYPYFSSDNIPSHNIISENIIDLNNIGMVGIYLSMASNNNVSGNIVINSTLVGLYLEISSDNILTRNTVSNHPTGISIYYSANNSIYENVITNNDFGLTTEVPGGFTMASGDGGGGGFYLPSSNNTIYHNNFVNNTQNAYDEYNNTWYNETLQEGNYWDDFDEPSEGAYDNNSDGIVDTPYNISGDSNQDLYPFMNPDGWLNSPPEADAGGPYEADEGTEITFNASESYDADLDELQYRWDFDNDSIWDTSYSTEPTATHTWHDDYTGTVAVEVYDGICIDVDTAVITVFNVAPVIDAGVDQTVDEGDLVTVESVFTDAGSADTHTATITWGDGNPVTTIDLAVNPLSATHVYADNGVYIVTVTVTDDDGGVGSDTLEITVDNVAPVVDAGVDQTIDEGDVVTVEPKFTDAGSADMHTATITWGDGNPVTTFDPAVSPLSATHVYADNRVYTVTVTMTDDDGGVGIDTLIITVNNVAPVVDAGADQTADEGDLVTVEPVFTDAGSADTHTVTIDWGDGTPVTTFFDPAISLLSDAHVYADNGVYIVTVTVTDDDGGIGSDALVITVFNVAPTVTIDNVIQPFSGFILPYDELEFHGSFTDPGTGDTHTIEWDFDDGAVATELTSTHAFAEPGNYTVTLTVIDDDGSLDVASVNIHVKSRVEAIEVVIGYVLEMDLSEDLENSLISKLDSAIDFLNNNQTVAAVNKLEAFINQVEAQRGKKLTEEEADVLIAAVQWIIDNINTHL